MKLLKNVWFYFVVVVALTIVTNQAYKTFFFRPCSYHQWRQSDGASYALNYYQYHKPFLPSQVHHRFAQDGKAMSELPLVYYIASKFYRIFGFHDYYIRLLHFSIFLLGLYYLIKITALYTRNILLQLIPFLFTISSPYLFFYGANFLPDVAALSLSIAGLYYFLLFDSNQKLKYIYHLCFFFVLAALLKISAIILFIAVIGCFALKIIKPNANYTKISTAQKIIICALFCLSISIVFEWIQYDKYVAAHYHFGGNLFGFLGIWETEKDLRNWIFFRLYNNWMHVILAKFTWVSLAIGSVLLMLNLRRAHNTLATLILLTTLGVLAYMIAFFKVFDVHDYYLVTSFCLPILVFIAIVDLINKKQWMSHPKAKYPLAVFFILLFAYASYKSAWEQNYRYFGNEYNTFNKDYYTVEPYLRSIGIKK